MDQHVPVGQFADAIQSDAHQQRAFWSAFLGYMFDCMDLNIFTLVMVPSMSELVQTTDQGLILQAGSILIAIKLICWGIGGVLFGVVADRFGRAPALVSTIATYAVFTAVSGLARSWRNSPLYRHSLLWESAANGP
jgi:MFS family permease